VASLLLENVPYAAELKSGGLRRRPGLLSPILGKRRPTPIRDTAKRSPLSRIIPGQTRTGGLFAMGDLYPIFNRLLPLLKSAFRMMI